MRIAVYGATGMVGSRVVAEARRRGHDVTGLSRRHALDLPEGVEARTGDAADPEMATDVASSHDVVVTAHGPARGSGSPGDFQASVENLVGRVGPVRLVVVGGAGSLEVSPGVTVLDSGAIPESYAGEVREQAAVLALLRAAREDLDWTYFSPPALIEPGERTGVFRLGGDQLLTDDEGQSRISAEDYAVALVDELERPAHRRQRLTVGY